MAYKYMYDAYLQFGNRGTPQRTVKCFECGETDDGRVMLKVGGEWDLRVRQVYDLPDNPTITLLGDSIPVSLIRKGA